PARPRSRPISPTSSRSSGCAAAPSWPPPITASFLSTAPLPGGASCGLRPDRLHFPRRHPSIVVRLTHYFPAAAATELAISPIDWPWVSGRRVNQITLHGPSLPR